MTDQILIGSLIILVALGVWRNIFKGDEMAWLAVDEDETEWICDFIPLKLDGILCSPAKSFLNAVELKKGSIKKLTGRKLTWEDEPVELKEKK